MDKSLLEIPEDEIDPQILPIKDLIRLQEYRERLAVHYHFYISYILF